MLETILADYLANLPNERAFDAPFLALLPALGFYDIHYTHGSAEFGKDFIAKKEVGGITTQFSFQLKRGFSQSEWRDVQNQLLEAVISGATHGSFDTTIPHQPVLVTTGRLSNQAGIGTANFNQKATLVGSLPLEIWEQPQLVEHLAQRGVAGVHRATASSLHPNGRFFSLYGEAIEGILSPRIIESYSRNWLYIPEIDVWPPRADLLANAEKPSYSDVTAKLTVAVLESSILAQRCTDSKLRYEGIYCLLGAWRAVLHAWHGAVERGDQALETLCADLNLLTKNAVHEAASKFITWVIEGWHLNNYQLGLMVSGLENLPSQIFTYPVHCARIVEIAGLLFLLEDSDAKRADLVSFLADFVSKEPGCSRPVGDYYAVSYVWPLLALGQASNRDAASSWWQELAHWFLDRFEHGVGLARLEATPEQEAKVLLGYSFDFLNIEPTSSSLLATVLADTAVWLGKRNSYEQFVPDLETQHIHPLYYQPPDSEGLFRLEAPDVKQLARVIYSPSFSAFQDGNFGSHIKLDKLSYTLGNKMDLAKFAALSILLRDRAFPALWPSGPTVSSTGCGTA